MKIIWVIVLLFMSFSLFASPTMDQVDHTQRSGIKIDLPTDPNKTGITHQHRDTQPPSTIPQDKKPQAKKTEKRNSGLMGR